MALTTLQRLRLKIADRERTSLEEQIGVGNGASVEFQAMLPPVVAESDRVYLVTGGVPVLQARGTDYTIDDDQGVVIFATAPPAGTFVRISYKWTTFTDVELDDLLTQVSSSLPKAAIEAVRWLLADTERFLRYTFGQESVDRSASRKALERLTEEWKDELGGVFSLVKADTPEREALMEPFIQQPAELLDVT